MRLDLVLVFMNIVHYEYGLGGMDDELAAVAEQENVSI